MVDKRPETPSNDPRGGSGVAARTTGEIMSDVDVRPSKPRVLVDTSAFRHTRVADVGFFPETFRLGSREIPIRVLGVRPRPLPGAEHGWLRQQVEAMPTITRLAQEKRILLCVYSELFHEDMVWPSYPSSPTGELLSGIDWEDVPAPVERGKFQQMDLTIYARKQTFVKFCKVLLGWNQTALDAKVDEWRFLTDFERNNLRNLSRFQEICSALQETHYPDAFHLWTAEVNKLDYFLVIDQKFINAMTRTSRISLRTKLMAPIDLVRDLGIAQLDPMP
jgi:hypothetical protein